MGTNLADLIDVPTIKRMDGTTYYAYNKKVSNNDLKQFWVGYVDYIRDWLKKTETMTSSFQGIVDFQQFMQVKLYGNDNLPQYQYGIKLSLYYNLTIPDSDLARSDWKEYIEWVRNWADKALIEPYNYENIPDSFHRFRMDIKGRRYADDFI